MTTRVDSNLLSEFKDFGAVGIEKCINCGNCTAICSMTSDDSRFPRNIIRMAQLGMKDEILGSKELWLCFNCGQCSDTCPQGAEPANLMAAARCYAAEGSLPYGPVVAWLRSHPLAALAAPWRAEVARILPDADGHSHGHGLDGDWERHRLFEALARAVLAWSQPCGAERRGKERGRSPAGVPPLPILLLLDDIQWCDHDTLDWLHFLLRWDPRSRLLVIGTARVEDMAADQPLAPLIASLRRNGLIAEIELGPLERDDIFALAAQVMGRALDPVLAEPLRRGSEGNPLFVVEMARAAASRAEPMDPVRRAAMLAAASQPLPPKLLSVLRARLAQLSPSALAIAQLVAVYGRPCLYDTLARAGGESEPELVQALDELWRRRILREVDEESYDFTHEKLREVCYEEMTAARRRLAHNRLAEAITAE